LRQGWEKGRGCARGTRRAVVASLCALAGILLWSAPAFALLQRGHTFNSSFASPSADGALSNPSGVAVNETTGDVYVVDRANNRIEQFDAAGNFIAAWGWGVKDGEKEYEVCKSKCLPGLPGSGFGKEKFHLGAGQMIAPEGIAVDNSSSPSAGSVYVVASVVGEKSFVNKYGPDGEYKKRVNSKEETEFDGRVNGVAVDQNGVVWLDWSEDEVTSFTGGEPNRHRSESEFTVEPGAEALRPGLAVDSLDNLYVNFEPSEKFAENEEDEGGQGEHGEQPCEGSTCYVSKLTSVEVVSEEADGSNLEVGEALIRGINGAAHRSRPMAVDLSNNDLYVVEGSDVAAYTPSGTLIQRFGSEQLARGGGVAVDSKTGTVYVTDATTGVVDVYTLEEPTKPRVDEVSATTITSEAATLDAQVDPAGAVTTLNFEYGTASCASSTCTSVAYGKSLEGFGDHAVSASLTGLAPNTVYFYRVIAKNTHGEATSEERHFTTQPPVSTFSLADGRAWEQVSPALKNGVGIESISYEGGLIQASEDGSAITYITTGPSESEPEGNRSPAFTQNLAVRSEAPAAWSSTEIAIPFERALGDFAGKLQEYLIFSPDLKSSLLEPRGENPQSEPALSPEATEKTIYVRQSENCLKPPSSCYTPVVRAANDTAEPKVGFGGPVHSPQAGLRVITATPDLSHVLLHSEVPLTNQAVAPAPNENFYEWSAGKPLGEQLQLVNVTTEGTPASSAHFGAGKNIERHTISNDGSRIVFTAGSHLYERDTATATTIQLDVAEAGAPAEANANPLFQTASSTGTRIFFTDEQQLTTNSLATKEAPDLYEFDTSTGKLSDLTPGVEGKPSAVQYLIPGASEDGSVVYFVANGALTSEPSSRGEVASAGECNPGFAVPGATCNLYFERYNATSKAWSSPKFVAALSNEDNPDWGNPEGNAPGLSGLTSRVSPTGRYLAFMSDMPLTGYDNRDANPASGGARAEEVFRFDSDAEVESEALTCVSCDPTGARPEGVHDLREVAEGLGPLVDRPLIWEGRWLAGDIPGWTRSELGTALYQSRYLTESGRLFFDATDGLVPADVNASKGVGTNDVYEYESNGEGSCASAGGCVSLMSSGTSTRESAFLDASSSGNDVFLLTSAALVTSDGDTNFDVYDARVCSTSSPCVTPPPSEAAPCTEADACKPPATSQPAFVAPATANPTGLGNLIPPKTSVLPVKTVKLTQRQKLAKALKACRKLKPKKKRVLCERHAHKRYPLKKSAKKASQSSRRARR
jgi:DNA-binding beta-propeller fold protein YncE